MQDDWRKSAKLTFNLGLRYELIWPFYETIGQMVNLDVTPDFTAAAPVASGETGPYTGVFPKALVDTDTNNVAPRVGFAWRVSPARSSAAATASATTPGRTRRSRDSSRRSRRSPSRTPASAPCSSR